MSCSWFHMEVFSHSPLSMESSCGFSVDIGFSLDFSFSPTFWLWDLECIVAVATLPLAVALSFTYVNICVCSFHFVWIQFIFLSTIHRFLMLFSGAIYIHFSWVYILRRQNSCNTCVSALIDNAKIFSKSVCNSSHQKCMKIVVVLCLLGNTWYCH